MPSRLPAGNTGRAMSPCWNVRLGRTCAACASDTMVASTSTPTTCSRGYSDASATLPVPDPMPRSATRPSHSRWAAVSATFCRIDASIPAR